MGCGASAPVNTKRTAAEIMFQKYDKDRSGKLDKLEFQKLCMAMGYNLTNQELEIDMKLLDLNGDGKIGYNEFCKWWKTEKRFQHLQWTPDRLKLIEMLAENFKAYDVDNSGVIDKQEFLKLHSSLVEQKITTKPADQVLKIMDTNNDGKIVFAEYARYVLQS